MWIMEAQSQKVLLLGRYLGSSTTWRSIDKVTQHPKIKLIFFLQEPRNGGIRRRLLGLLTTKWPRRKLFPPSIALTNLNKWEFLLTFYIQQIKEFKTRVLIFFIFLFRIDFEIGKHRRSYQTVGSRADSGKVGFGRGSSDPVEAVPLKKSHNTRVVNYIFPIQNITSPKTKLKDGETTRHQWRSSSPCPSTLTGPQVLGSSNFVATRGLIFRGCLQHIDHNDWCRYHVDSGNHQGPRRNSWLASDTVGRFLCGSHGGVPAQVHQLRWVWNVRRHGGGVFWGVGFGGCADLCHCHQPWLPHHLFHHHR